MASDRWGCRIFSAAGSVPFGSRLSGSFQSVNLPRVLITSACNRRTNKYSGKLRTIDDRRFLFLSALSFFSSTRILTAQSLPCFIHRHLFGRNFRTERTPESSPAYTFASRNAQARSLPTSISPVAVFSRALSNIRGRMAIKVPSSSVDLFSESRTRSSESWRAAFVTRFRRTTGARAFNVLINDTSVENIPAYLVESNPESREGTPPVSLSPARSH